MVEELDADARHPDATDLLNLARQQLGTKKSQRILDHCKECPPCADQLLELVREHAPAPEKRPLSWWNWASIVLFVVALGALAVTMVWFLRSVAQTTPFDIPPAETPSTAPGEREPPA